MKLIDELANTPKANSRLKAYYIKNNWSLQIDFFDWLKLDFRYQQGVFIDYLCKENIGINIAHSGYILYILDTRDFKDLPHVKDWMFTVTDDGLYIIDAQPVKHEAHINTVDLMMQETLKHGILRAFQLIHSVGTGYSDSFSKKLQDA